ncbi:MAG: ribonuclease HII [Sulfolobales archaeon]
MDESEVIAGIDEAGRGPLIGPMVIAAVVLSKESLEELIKAGVRDSKRLSRSARERLAPLIIENSLATIAVMLAPKDLDSDNINTVEIKAIERILSSISRILGFCPKTYIDLFVPLERISNLYSICPDIIAEHRADARYHVVGAASIVAKVLRDWHIESIKSLVGDFGSGYPSDPRTREWVSKAGEEDLKLISPFIRHKWATLDKLRHHVNTLDRYILNG